MDDLLSEKEQIEKLRGWWSSYGAYVVAGIVLGALALFGINYFQSSNTEAELEASALYDELSDDVVDGDLDAAEVVTDQLRSNHADSAYTAQAMLALARLYMDQNRDQDAADQLRALLASPAIPEFKDVARLRLAKLLLYQNKADEVLTLLEGVPDDGAFAARFAEAKADAYVALDRPDEARSAYERALSEPSQQATINQAFVQLKLLDLPLQETAASDDHVAAGALQEDAGTDEVDASANDTADEEAE
ncbi:MAG TPA: tetratricopeptide repeat protein [Woeseiaceae bacterium]|nr:tetratricopeptide repeat protein [Woeseiaceae bacterium]